MECQKCGKVAPEGVKFCPGCGARLGAASAPTPAADAICPACGAPHAPGVKFCKHCGASIRAPAPASAPAEPAPVSATSELPAKPAGAEAPVASATVDAASAADTRASAAATPEPKLSETPAETVAASSAQPAPEQAAPTPEPEGRVAHAASASIDRPSAGGGRKGLLFGVLSLVVVIVLAGAAVAYFKFAKPTQDTEAANVAPASAVSSAGAMPIAPVPAASTAIAPAVSSPTTSAVASPHRPSKLPLPRCPRKRARRPLQPQSQRRRRWIARCSWHRTWCTRASARMRAGITRLRFGMRTPRSTCTRVMSMRSDC